MKPIKLYDWQIQGVNDIQKAFKKNTHVCLAWYTGAGKTNALAELCARLIEEDPDVKIGISAYMTTEIKEQVAERLTMFGLGTNTHVVRYRTVKHSPTHQITVFNPQGLFFKIPKVKFDYLILDEAHTGINKYCNMLPSIIKKNTTKATRVLLVSATPWDTLAQDEFKHSVVFKRPLDQGLKDGLITDFTFHAEEAQVEFKEKDFTREGDLSIHAITAKMRVIKSACIGKMEYIIKTYDKRMGDKVLVICPPGNYSEIARELAKRFDGLPYVMSHEGRGARGGSSAKSLAGLQDTGPNLERFKTEAAQRFLFVTNKCQTGFDFQEMTSVIDLTMSRNIRALAQRMGRIARKDGDVKKHYFYVYDKSLMKNRLEWLILTVTDFCLGAYDGWTTRTAKYREVVKQQTMAHPVTITLGTIIKALREPGSIETQETLKFVQHSRRVSWTLPAAVKQAKTYASRTTMWKIQPSLYKWFRLNAKAEMDRIFPIKNQLGKWNETTVLAVMKEHTGKMLRKEFMDTYGGIEYWITKVNEKKGRVWLDKYFPRTLPPWTKERAVVIMKQTKHWPDIRKNHSGLRQWMQGHGGEAKWKKMWVKIHGETLAGRFLEEYGKSSKGRAVG